MNQPDTANTDTQPTRIDIIADLTVRNGELERENARLRVQLETMQMFATMRVPPPDEERVPMNVHPQVRADLNSWLMKHGPRGEGYSEFIAKALAWRKRMSDTLP